MEYNEHQDCIGSYYDAISELRRRHKTSQHNAAERGEAVQFGDRTQPTPVSIQIPSGAS